MSIINIPDEESKLQIRQEDIKSEIKEDIAKMKRKIEELDKLVEDIMKKKETV